MSDLIPPEAEEEIAEWMRSEQQREWELRQAEEVAQWHFNYGRRKHESLSSNS